MPAAAAKRPTPLTPRPSRAHAESLARAARASGAGHFDVDLALGRVWYEPRLRALLGLPVEHGFAALQALVHDEERGTLLQAVRLHLEQQQPLDVELRLRTAAGEWRWFRLVGATERDDAGRPRHLSGRLEDVTERRRADARVRATGEFLRGTLDALPLAVGVLDGAGEIVEINRAWRELPCDRALVGLRFGFGEHYPRLLRAAAERCAAGPAAADGLEAVLRGERGAFELVYAAASSGADRGPRTLRLRAEPCDLAAVPLAAGPLAASHGAAGDPAVREPAAGRPVAGDLAVGRGVLVTHEDVTDLQDAHAAADATREFYELLLDTVPLHIAYVNRRRELVYANRCYEEWFGLPLARLQGRPLEALTSAEHYRQVAPRVEAALAGRTVEFTTRIEREGGTQELAVSYLPDLAGTEVRGFFTVARDVTAQRRLEAELRHAQKLEAVGRLTGGIAHDFNNLLSVVIGNLQLLERPLREDARLGGQLGTALRAALRGADLTRRLLAFSRQQVLEPRVLAPNRLIGGVLELVRRTLGPAIEVESALAPDAWPLHVDPGPLENSILNLALNARDAMPDGGRLVISTANRRFAEGDPARHPQLAPGDYVEIAVHDTGVGMPPEVAKRAFEPFFTTKELGRGTGLGLSTTWGFAEQSGGLAALESEPGRGTCVRLWFPRSRLPGVPQPEHVADAELPRGSESVLVVDDDADVRATACAALRALGYRVQAAAAGEEALALLASAADGPAAASAAGETAAAGPTGATGARRVDLLLADVLLPGRMPGPELARRARARCARLRVLLTSGIDHDGGADPVLRKPWAIGELARAVRTALDQERSTP